MGFGVMIIVLWWSFAFIRMTNDRVSVGFISEDRALVSNGSTLNSFSL